MKLKRNDKFVYQLTQYMSAEELKSFIEPFTADHCVDGLHYTIKKNGNGELFAIYTQGKDRIKEYNNPARRQMEDVKGV